MRLVDIILEQINKPKAVIMAGGAGAGKSWLLHQLNLDSLEQFNPDKYIEDPNHPYYNKLGPAANQINKDVAAASEEGKSFVWDTTASNPEKVKDLLSKGYDVFMVMIYTHPMIAFISNFERKRNVPTSAIFQTWRNVYQLIEEYDRLLEGNIAIFINNRDGKYQREMDEFDNAAKKGSKGISDYLETYKDRKQIGPSSFRNPVELDKEQQIAFDKEVSSLNYDPDNYSVDRAVKKAFLKFYEKNGAGPGADKLKTVVTKALDSQEQRDMRNKEVLNNIGDMLYSEKFQDLLKHSTVGEIDNKVQNFLK